MAGLCHIWIPNYDLMAYEVLKGGERELLQWNKDHQWTFETLEPELSRAPALGLPNLENSLPSMFIRSQGQRLETWPKNWDQSEASDLISEQLDSVALGWPSCPWAVAATDLLVNKASKFTLGWYLVVLTSHRVQSGLEVKGHHWLTGEKLKRY